MGVNSGILLNHTTKGLQLKQKLSISTTMLSPIQTATAFYIDVHYPRFLEKIIVGYCAGLGAVNCNKKPPLVRAIEFLVGLMG